MNSVAETSAPSGVPDSALADRPLAATAPTSAERFLEMLLRLAEGLRASGVDIAMVEVLDASEALGHIDLSDRRLLRACLQATMIKRSEDVEAFQRVFSACFPLTSAASSGAATPVGLAADGTGRAVGEADLSGQATGDSAGGAGTAEEASTALLESLLECLRSGDEDALRSLAGRAIDQYGGMQSTTSGERYYLHRVLRALDLSSLLVSAMRDTRAAQPDIDPLALRHVRDDLSARLDELRRLIAEQIHQRLHGGLVIKTGTGLIAPRRLEDVDVMRASTTELRALRQAVRPLARKLAAKVTARRRRQRRGRLDVRKTARRSLEYGGVPLEPIYKSKRPAKPSVVVLCDVSGSVAEFAHFTLTLLHALQNELAGLRSFIFVDGVREVTDILRQAEAVVDPRLLITLPGVVVDDGHSNFASAFRRFLDGYSSAITPATTLIVTGDARTNYRSPGLEEFDRLCSSARRVYWLNPEPESEWAETDSALRLYGDRCDGVFEVRTLAQLGKAIEEIL